MRKQQLASSVPGVPGSPFLSSCWNTGLFSFGVDQFYFSVILPKLYDHWNYISIVLNNQRKFCVEVLGLGNDIF